VTPDDRRRMQKKRQKNIQKYLDEQVLQEAATEAWLEESMMETEIVSREQLVFDSRSKIIKWQMEIAAAKKKTQLQKLASKVESALDRFAFAQESLQQNSARKIQEIEDKYAREEDINERKLQKLAAEEETKKNIHKHRRRDHLIFHARDINKAEEDLIAGIQASENEEPLSEDEDQEDQDEEDDEDPRDE
jgi:hypothetical protein